MSRCKEFYDKWEKEPNWCVKCEEAVRLIDDYIALTNELECRGVSKETTMVGLTERAARPLFAIKDNVVREKAITHIENALKRKTPQGGNYHKRLTTNDVQQIIENISNVKIKTQQAMNATVYSHASLEYYTPEQFINAARDVMGSIDTDPATCEVAQKWIKAKTFYTEKEDGLSKEWSGNVWLNPPYSKTNGQSNQEIWALKLLEEYNKGNVTSGILLVKAALGYNWFEKLWDILPVCFARERLSFILSNGTDDGQSKQATAFFYIGKDIEKFKSIFSKYGRVILP